MRDMMSVLLNGVLDKELVYSKYDYRNKDVDNSRNSHSTKTIHIHYEDMEMTVPHDHNGQYEPEPQFIKKYQITMTLDMEEKVLSMYAKGMTTKNIESYMKELYDVDIFDNAISQITDKVLSIVKE